MKKYTTLFALLLLLVISALLSGFVSRGDQAVFRPADDGEKSLVSASQWVETDGDVTYVCESRTYVYDE